MQQIPPISKNTIYVNAFLENFIQFKLSLGKPIHNSHNHLGRKSSEKYLLREYMNDNASMNLPF